MNEIRQFLIQNRLLWYLGVDYGLVCALALLRVLLRVVAKDNLFDSNVSAWQRVHCCVAMGQV